MLLFNKLTEFLNQSSQFLLIDVPNLDENLENPYSPLSIMHYDWLIDQKNKSSNIAKFAFIIRTINSEKRLGLGEDSTQIQTDWELIEEGVVDKDKILIFIGVNNNINGKTFNGIRIAFIKDQVTDVINLLNEIYPEVFSVEKIKSTTCLENIYL